MEGAYKGYKSVECIMAGMHDFTCYLKRGFGRASMQAATDIRQGLLTREEAWQLVEEFDCVRPEALDYFLEITGMSEQEFHEIMKKKRHEKIKDYELVVKKKHHKNTERIKPFAEYMIEKNINQPDPRERNE